MAASYRVAEKTILRAWTVDSPRELEFRQGKIITCPSTIVHLVYLTALLRKPWRRYALPLSPHQRAASRRDAATLTEGSSERPDQAESKERRPVGASHRGRLDEPVEQKDDELLEDGKMRDTAVQAGSAMRRSSRCVKEKLPLIVIVIIFLNAFCENETNKTDLVLIFFKGLVWNFGCRT